MAVDVRVEELIRRPRPAVAAFMFDPRNDATWTTGVVSSRPFTELPLRRGSSVERISRFLGREFGYTYQVLDTDGQSYVDMRVTEPFPMQIRYELREAADGTLASIHAQGDASGFFRIASPLMAPMVRRNIQKDLRNLKVHLEERPDGQRPP